MAHNNQKVLIAMKKARTSLDKVMQMNKDNAYCIDVIQQNLAVIGLVRSANLNLFEVHVDHSIRNAAKKGGKELNEKMEELIKVIKIAQTK